MLYTVLPYRRMHGRQTTFELLRVLKWSLYWARRGRFPPVDHLGESWPRGSPRDQMANKPLTGDSVQESHRLAFVQFRADEDFYAFVMCWSSYRHNSLCPRCPASKTEPGLLWTHLQALDGQVSV